MIKMTARRNPVSKVPPRKIRDVYETLGIYVFLCLMAVITIFPFIWVFFTSFKGPKDQIITVPPQLFPSDPTLANYIRVWNQLPISNYFLNSILVAGITVIINLLITSLAAYPLAKIKFKGRDAIFYGLLATFVVPPQLLSIPNFILAVKFFKYYDTIFALIFPSLATVFNIFMMRQAFKAIPNDLIEAGRMDGASELRIWWKILLPIIKPTLATAAIFTFVNQWNDFFWPSLMLHTPTRMTLQVGLVALQSMFVADSRGIAAGVVMAVIPIIIFFVALQKQFIHGLTGAVKG